MMKTIAGTPGVKGFSGDGGKATDALFGYEYSLRLVNGEVLVSDTENQRIRKIASNGIVSTVIGNGTRSMSTPGRFSHTVTFHTCTFHTCVHFTQKVLLPQLPSAIPSLSHTTRILVMCTLSKDLHRAVA